MKGRKVRTRIFMINADYGGVASVVSHTGFIAQDVEQVFPEFVATSTDGKKSVAYSNFVPAMVSAIQQLNSKVNAIDTRLTNLEALVASGNSTLGVASGNSQGLSLTGILTELTNQFETIGAKFVDGIAYFKNIFTGGLTVGTHDKPTGITLYDEVTNDPYCLKMRNGAMVSEAGGCPENSPTLGENVATSTPSDVSSAPALGDVSVPVISILGDNPATITVGTSYSDMNATVTDTNADGSVNNNLGITTFLDGVEMQSIYLDTSTTSVHTILYKATDGAGNIGQASRTVNIVSQ